MGKYNSRGQGRAENSKISVEQESDCHVRVEQEPRLERDSQIVSGVEWSRSRRYPSDEEQNWRFVDGACLAGQSWEVRKLWEVVALFGWVEDDDVDVEN